MKVLELCYVLSPGMRLGQLEDQFFLYDKGLGSRRLLKYSTTPVSDRLHTILKALCELDYPIYGEKLLKQLKEFDLTESELESLITIGALNEHSPPEAVCETRDFMRGLYTKRFEQRDLRRIVSTPSIFNLPTDLGTAKPTVAFKGVAISSFSQNRGTEYAPDYLRHITGSFINWFDIYRDGIFSDLCLGSNHPTIGKDVVAADFGDIDFGDGHLASIFQNIETSISEEFLAKDIKPIFIGGDHAVTFPIMKAMHKNLPNIGLLHLDAHHDVFFGDQIQYSNAFVIANLLFHTGVDPIFSFGLRARADFVGPQTSNLLKLPEAQRWWSRVSTINECRRYLLNPNLLDSLLEGQQDRPFFLTIDLDVLSPEAISGKVMTPIADGLSWSEFFELLELLFQRLKIVGCDITELNPFMGSSNEQTDESLCLLIIYLIEKLGRKYE